MTPRKTKLQIWNVVAALVIFLLLGLHMTIMHTNALPFLAPYGEDRDIMQNVLFRDRHLFFTVTYVLLLGAALSHGLFGLRTMLLERAVAPKAQHRITTILLVVGGALFALGAWAAIAAHWVAIAAG